MAKNLLLVMFLLIGNTTFCQDIQSKSIGFNYKTGSEIVIDQYVFPKEIFHFEIDTVNKMAVIQLRKLSKNKKVWALNGEYLGFDFFNKATKWNKKIDYSIKFLSQNGPILFECKKASDKIVKINSRTGEEEISFKSDIFYVVPEKNFGLGYKGSGSNRHILEGLNLSTGNTIWEKEVRREYDVTNILGSKDSVLMVSDGIHKFCIENGNGWSIVTKTGKKDYKETVAKNVVGIALAGLTGVGFVSSGPNTVKNVHSNIAESNGNFYFASKEKISSINKQTGIINWEFTLPEDQTSSSSLFVKDSLLLMVNRGYANWGAKKIDFGKSFLLGLNINTGEQYYFKTFEENKHLVILDILIKNEEFFILTSNKIQKFNSITGELLGITNYETEKYGELNHFVSQKTYLETTEGLQLANVNSELISVITATNNLFYFSKNLEEVNRIEKPKFYYHYANYTKNKLLKSFNDTLILDENNNKLAKIETPINAVLVNNLIFNANGANFYIVDLETITVKLF